MDAGESGRRRLERLRQQEADCEQRLVRIRRRIHAIELGNAGEVKIAKLLEELPDGWRVLHDRRKAPRSPANIDHIVIGPTGVHVIDTKNWSGNLWVGDKGVICGRRPMAEEARSLADVRGLIAEELTDAGKPAPVYGVIALATDDSTKESIVCDGIAYIPPDQLVNALLSPASALTPEQVYRIWELLDDVHPPHASAIAEPKPRLRGRRAPLPAVRARSRPPRGRGRATSIRSSLSHRLLSLAAALLVLIVGIAVLEHTAKDVSKSLVPTTGVSSPAPTPSSADAADRATQARAGHARPGHTNRGTRTKAPRR